MRSLVYSPLLAVAFAACTAPDTQSTNTPLPAPKNETPTTCGDDIRAGKEACDGKDLGASTCETLGFGKGKLACKKDCSDYDRSQCGAPKDCGNNKFEAPESCDGTKLNGTTCESLGFERGVLACLENCTEYDVSGCIAKAGTCGNGVIDQGETCDGAKLAGATCESIGLDAGALTCNATCKGYDVSACIGGCVPQCGTLACGPDPICGQSCGKCGAGETCTSAGQCGNFCALGSSRCTSDGYGFEACGPESNTAKSNTYGTRIPCGAGNACSNGNCQRSACIETEVLWLVDRSSSMLSGGTWTWLKKTYLDELAKRHKANVFGQRQFPESSACSAGSVIPLNKNNLFEMRNGLADPTSDAATPIQAALTSLTTYFGDPNDGQAVILITDGDETCGTQAEAIAAAGALFRSGIRVYVIGVTTTANKSFLDQVAAAGGTKTSTLVTNASQLSTAVDKVFADLSACTCKSDTTLCLADTEYKCSADERSWLSSNSCDAGCIDMSKCRLQNPVSLSASYTKTCAITSGGAAVCWGQYLEFETTTGTFTQMSVGYAGTCALQSNGSLACWGNDVKTPPVGTFSQVSTGMRHACALSGSTIQCWPSGSDGSVPAGSYKQVSAGSFFSCVIKTDDTLACWGPGSYGEATPPSGKFKQVSAGNHHACALGTNGLVSCWGNNSVGQASPATGTFIAVSAGDDHTCAIKSDSTLSCWGSNERGALNAPGGTFTSVTAGGSHTCAVKTKGGVLCWGDDSYGQATVPAAP